MYVIKTVCSSLGTLSADTPSSSFLPSFLPSFFLPSLPYPSIKLTPLSILELLCRSSFQPEPVATNRRFAFLVRCSLIRFLATKEGKKKAALLIYRVVWGLNFAVFFEVFGGNVRLHYTALVWSGLVWFGLVWCGLVWCGLVWFIRRRML